MNILSDGILFTLTNKKFTEFLALYVDNVLPSDWLLKNATDIKIADVDLSDFTQEQAKENLREIVFSPDFTI